jgi:hypothetical protein
MKHGLVILVLLVLAAAGCGERTALYPVPDDPGAAVPTDGAAPSVVPSDGAAPPRRTDGPAPTPDAAPTITIIPRACQTMGITSTRTFETNFIVRRCGLPMCHGPSSVFPPRMLDMPNFIRAQLVGRKATLACKNDFYIDRGDPARSFVLAKVSATGTQVTCPSGGQGGLRMPNKAGMPTVVGDRLTQPELDCFTWWVFQVARE